MPACLSPACLIANIFVLTGDIGGQYRGRRREGRCGWTQEPEGRRMWVYGGKGDIQVRTGRNMRHGGGGVRDNRGNSGDINGGGREETNNIGSVGVQERQRSRGGVPRRR